MDVTDSIICLLSIARIGNQYSLKVDGKEYQTGKNLPTSFI